MNQKLTKQEIREALENKLSRYFGVSVEEATVEPVLGTLINHHNMKRINSRGMAQANKHVLLAALCYNLKKYLKFQPKQSKLLAQICALPKEKSKALKSNLFSLYFSSLEPLSF